MSFRTVVQVAVKGFERGIKANRSDVQLYVLQVSWSDGTKYIIYRSYAEIFSMHVKLVEAFPIEAGKVSIKDKVLPDFAADDRRCLPAQALANVALYFERLLRLDRKIATYKELVTFVTLTPTDKAAKDVQPSSSATLAGQAQNDNGRQAKETKATSAVNEISGPLPLETYIVAASYKSKGKGEVTLNTGDMVDVVDKNANGWWYVRVDDQEGWAPSTYLQLANDDYTTEECQCLSGEIFLTTKAYAAQQSDELSFPCNASIEIMNKIKDGWWIGSYDGKVGYVPAAYLTAYSDPYLESEIRSCTRAPLEQRPTIPVQRRKTIKGLKEAPERDLTMYRKASQRNRRARAIAATTATAQSDATKGMLGVTVQDVPSRGDTCGNEAASASSLQSSTGPAESCTQREEVAATVGTAPA